MFKAKRQDRSPVAKTHHAYRPHAQVLEDRRLMAIDLTNIATRPYGVLEAGQNTGDGAGYSVAEVGDVNGDGYDDFVVGAPGITSNSNGSFDLNTTKSGTAFLVFGSRDVNSTTNVDWAGLVAQQRIGDLGALGNPSQTNPNNGAAGFAFDGLTFRANQNTNAGLGTSVAALGDINGDGFADFMIGAPGANNVNGTSPGTGRAYLVFGGSNLNRATKSIDLDNLQASSDLNIITFIGDQAGGRAGRSVGLAGDVLTDGTPDIAIGAPLDSVGGVTTSGAVFLISGQSVLPASSRTILLSTVGQGGTTNTGGVLLGGGNQGDEAGTSLAPGGSFDGRSIGGLRPGSLLIGAPGTAAQLNGSAYLVYGQTNLANLAVTQGGQNFISLSRVTATDATAVPGAQFIGEAAGNVAGFSVANGGDFNNDGLGDILIGAPAYSNNTGREYLIYGRAASGPGGAITGVVNLGAQLPTIPEVVFTGQGTNALAGYSATATRAIASNGLTGIAIGSPGVATGAGAVYLIPGNGSLVGPVTLSVTGIENPTIAGQTITVSQPTTQRFLGTSVSGRLGATSAGRTLDNDGVGDLIVGSAGYALSTSRTTAGGVFALEGRFIPLRNPVSTAITSDIGVERPNAPFTVNATTPDNLVLYIESRNENVSTFVPPTDIDPATIRVNGVLLPDPTTFQSVPSVDGDGIADAKFTFSPRSLLALTNATTTLTITARTLATSPLANRNYSGTATITVTGGGGGGGGGGGQAGGTRGTFFGVGPTGSTPPPFGEAFIPTTARLSQLTYKPIPIRAAYAQYQVKPSFAIRNFNLFHPGQAKALGAPANGHAGRTQTLKHNVFTRGRYKAGQAVGVIHHGKKGGTNTIPRSLV